jgi:pimeloyl-ACP methyl ester carboxylesterase
VVLLHGNLSRGAHWAPQIAALAPLARVVAPDMRGFGASDAEPLPSSLVAVAADVAGLCAALGVRRAHVVGLSLGGTVAQAVAVRHPGLVASLVLASTYRIDDPHPVVAAMMGGSAADIPPMEALAPMVRGGSFSPAFAEANPEVVDRIVAELLATRRATFLATVSLFDEADQAPAPAITAPTLVVGTTHDAIAPPEVTRHLADAVPGAAYELVDSGHMVNVEQPDAFTALVRSTAGV